MIPHAGHPFSKGDDAGRGVNRRAAGRVSSDQAACSLGPIVDLSATGMQVRCGFFAPGVGEAPVLTIHGPDGPFQVRARVVWRKRAGIFSHYLGLEFIELSPQARHMLSTIARVSAANQQVVPLYQDP